MDLVQDDRQKKAKMRADYRKYSGLEVANTYSPEANVIQKCEGCGKKLFIIPCLKCKLDESYGII